jgi:DNA-binding CsgD family transcriptional regulator
METLSIDDMQKLNDSIQQIYTLHDLDTFGTNALSIVTQLVPSDLPVFHSTHVRTRQISSTFLPSFPGFSPELEQIANRYSSEHPITQHMPQTLTGAYKVSDFVTQEQLHRLTGIYQQFLKPLNTEDQMFLFLLHPNPLSWVKLLQSEANLVGFALHRPQRNFSERDRTVLNLLRPHLYQAHNNAQKYQQLQQNLHQLQQSLDCLGVVVLDTQGRVKSIAPQVSVWLETYFEKSTCSHQLPDLLRSWVMYRVNYLKHPHNLQQTFLPLRIQAAERELVIRLVIEPSRNRYLLMFEERDLYLFNSMKMLGLSDRETEVLYWIVQGKDNKEIALQLSVFPSTVRKHLENIYNKLDVKSRTEAIAQALTKLGLLNSLPLS